MAGSLGNDTCKACKHGKTCLIKTGVTNKKSYLKSFYICPVLNDGCGFQEEAIGLPLMKCPLHVGEYVELRLPIVNESSGEKKIKYRCQKHEERKWCGTMAMEMSDSKPIEKNLSTESKPDAISNQMSFRDSIIIIDDEDSNYGRSEKIDEREPKDCIVSNTKSESTSNNIVEKPHKDSESSAKLPLDASKYDCYVKKYTLKRLERELKMMEGLLKHDLTKLSDGGEKIKVKVEELSQALEYMRINGSKVDDDDEASDSENNSKTLDKPKENIGIQYTEAMPMVPQKSGGGYPKFPHSMRVSREYDEVISEAINRLHAQFESCPDKNLELNDPNGLKVCLLVHQRQALKWLTWRELQQPRGGILADDMGLGKTLTMISLVLNQKQSSLEEPEKSGWMNKSKSCVHSNSTLVVCPSSLVHQWEKEILGRLKPGLISVSVFHGPNRSQSVKELAGSDVVLTTYGIVSSEIKATPTCDSPRSREEGGKRGIHSSVLERIHWKRIILDEGHVIKNHKSLTATSICQLKSDIRWIVTGTPIHNNLMDLYSLLRFLKCSPFDDYNVWKGQVDNKSGGGQNRLNILIKALMLRRTKDQQCSVTNKPLVSLPQKTFKVYDIVLSKDERSIYDKLFAKSKTKMQQYLDDRDEKEANKKLGSKVGSDGRNNNATQILLMLLRLRQSCCHPHLMKEAVEVTDLHTDQLEVDLAEQLCSLNINGKSLEDVASSTDLLFSKDTQSMKIKYLIEVMESVRQDCKANNTKIKSVVVSQWTKMLDIVEHHLRKANFRCCTIKGDIVPKKRSEIVDKFNLDPHGPEVLLLSLRAGGTGLNLVGGSHLYIVDLHWNPALEQQACDRVYRVGQSKNVFIHKFVCKDTIEENIGNLQRRKMDLANNVLTGVGTSTTKLSLEDLRILFGIEARKKFF